MKNLTVGVHVAGTNVSRLIDGIAAAERAGIQCAWLTCGGVAPDPLVVFTAAAIRTSRILLGTSIIPTFPRHPLALVQGALAVDALAPGRLRLGVGPSHKPSIEGTWGIPFERPQEHLREYLTILQAALKGGKVDFDGKRLKAHAQLPGPTRVTVMASALRAIGFRTCGELADGAISWVCPLPYLRDVAAPALRDGAAKAGRATPPLIAHVPVAVTEDAGGVRKGATEQLGRYPRVPYYSQMFQDAGLPRSEGRSALRSDDRRAGRARHGHSGQGAPAPASVLRRRASYSPCRSCRPATTRRSRARWRRWASSRPSNAR